jgi:hypothetical protein
MLPIIGAVAGGLGLLNSFRKPKVAPAPDYTKIAQEQAALNRTGATDVYGNTSGWSQDPDGTWRQTASFSPENQQLYNKQLGLLGMNLDQMGANGSFDPNLPEMGDMSMSNIGTSKEAQDLMWQLLAPMREKARNSEMQRLANQGLNLGNANYDMAMERLGQDDNDAMLKSALAGLSEYNNQFNRALSTAQFQNQSNQQAFGQQLTEYQTPFNNYQLLRNMAPTTAFPQKDTSGIPNVYGAAQDQYAANVQGANAVNAQRNNLTQGLMGIAGTGLKAGMPTTPGGSYKWF